MPKKSKRDLISHFFDIIQTKFEQATLRDIAYIVSFLSGVFIAYNIIAKIREEPLLKVVMWDILTYQFPIRPELITEKIETKELNLEILGLSCIASYIVLKTDMDDIVSATGKLTSLATSLAAI